ncbi:MAG: hypothetical protein GVY13_15670 [Alphaproteobacteria bacterium]|jgi:hypothetical protein|nr:hypothetical protein [Alphaproteobacteria bacterium]
MVGRVRHPVGIALSGLGLLTLAACADPAADIPADPLFEETARPAERQDYPNLSTVPPRPEGLPTPEDRARIREALERDRALLREQAAPPPDAP